MPFLTNKKPRNIGEKIRRFVFGKFVKTCHELDNSFFRAANILDPEWMQTNSSDSDGIRNISTIEAKVSRNQNHRFQNWVIKAPSVSWKWYFVTIIVLTYCEKKLF